MRYINVKQVKIKVKTYGKRSSTSFLLGLDRLVEHYIEKAVKYSACKKTLIDDDIIDI